MHSYDGQRKHVIHSLASLLYQLHTLSFLLSPSIWLYVARVTTQWQFSRPRSLDPSRSLRVWFLLSVLFNLGALWDHAKEGAAQGRSIILDFVGMSHLPSKLHLLSLDFLIIFLQMLLTVIAYETSLAADMPSNTPDPLLPTPITATHRSSEETLKTDSPYIIDLRFPLVIDRLRNPPPPPAPRERSLEEVLPLPNTTPWRLSSRLQELVRMGQGVIEHGREGEAAGQTQRDEGGEDEQVADTRQAVPGALSIEDGP
ncbi:uncharacterized protein LAESUDRAFT_721462 [Laetiporus sulphureus 93-53]|uniref:DUF1746 domain-containing protein n=1 Tax=Laetiporus sulphureus 93-53 TaxID=1314785 RepID=A0A165GZI2_9APHY|nr:uncharacterized protein LAESUDRAFT_721462 [Laetiporus sulphureus 93-53]KZT11042.1 hypothetical protein LAESUDRAFT_721462 [Laetiporus sulphureus 93-53]